ncbi:EamA family transporter [Clostridiaceae bacterium NSJ-31]|uniref:EamA family transporter n=1 Tax=Ligaoa zhengdingensis TaxID=2763658 RepID=A0A926DYN3_9FIRM|nr:EamA family transporter [Ligaoa zhengdingensis]MBC8545864.1 EamA family transporter [Ligaoa zhengdingensis]
MLSYYLPALLIVCSNVVYNLCTKSVPARANSYFTLFVVYLVGAAVSLGLFFATSPEKNLTAQLHTLNWAPLLLGFSVVGLEAGYILLYRAGWKVSVGSLVCNIALALVLLVIGVLFYREKLSANQLVGMALCLGGLWFINR